MSSQLIKESYILYILIFHSNPLRKLNKHILLPNIWLYNPFLLSVYKNNLFNGVIPSMTFLSHFQSLHPKNK